MNINKIEELINSLDSNKEQCKRCKKWFNKGEFNYDFIRRYNVCNKCSKRIYPNPNIIKS